MKILISLYLKDLLRNKMLGLLIILVPVIFYPMIYWGINQFLMLKTGFSDNQKISLKYDIADERYLALEDSFAALKNFIPEKTSFSGTERGSVYLKVLSKDDLPSYIVGIDSSNSVHTSLYPALDEILRSFYDTELKKRIGSSGSDEKYFRAYEIKAVNTDGTNEIIVKILSFLIPIMAFMSVLGSCVSASVELASGQSEDRTSETTMTAPVKRETIMMAKIITVTIYGVFAGIVSFSFLVAFLIQIFKTFLDGMKTQFELFRWSDILNYQTALFTMISLIVVSFTLSVIFITAAGFASKRKEGGVLVSPFTALISYLPIVIIIPAIEPNILIAATPVLNVAFALKIMISNDMNYVFILQTAAFSIVWALAVYKFLFPFLLEEDVLLGYSNSSLNKKMKIKMAKWKKR
jgi:hypothetical protein